MKRTVAAVIPVTLALVSLTISAAQRTPAAAAQSARPGALAVYSRNGSTGSAGGRTRWA